MTNLKGSCIIKLQRWLEKKMGQVCHSFVYAWIRYWPWMPKFWPWALTLQGISDVYIPPKCAQSLNILPLMTPHNQWWLLLPGLHYLLQCCPGHQHVYNDKKNIIAKELAFLPIQHSERKDDQPKGLLGWCCAARGHTPAQINEVTCRPKIT